MRTKTLAGKTGLALRADGIQIVPPSSGRNRS
jgi:hypothetical protein